MRHASNEKREMTHNGRNGTTKSRKNPNTRRKGNLLGNIGSGHYQTIGDERKISKEKTTRSQTI